MASFGEVFGALGVGAGGLAQGIEAGLAINQRQQALEIQKRQANLQAIQSFSEVMAPGMDPVVREMALQNIVPTLGLKPEDGIAFAKAANKLDDESRAKFVDFLRTNPSIAEGNIPLDVMAKNFLKNPMETMKFINDDVNMREDNKLKKDEFQHRKNVDEQQLDIAEGNLAINQEQVGMERQRLQIAQQAGELAIQTHAIQARQQGIEALTKAANIKDDKLRGMIVNSLNDQLGLGLTQEELIAFEVGGEDSLDEIADKLKIEETLLDIQKKAAGFGLTKTEHMSMLGMRAAGETPDSMPQFIKDMTPEMATLLKEQLSKPIIQIGGNKLQTKGKADKFREDIISIESTQSMLKRMTGIIEKDPMTAGMLGTAVRFSQKVSGSIGSFAPLVTEAKQGIGMLLSDSDPTVKGEVTKILANPNVQVVEVLEAAVRLKVARELSETGRILKSDYAEATQMIDITGFVGDPEMVITRLNAVNDVLDTLKKGKQEALDTNKLGSPMPQDIQDDEDYQDFLNEIEPSVEEDEEE